MANPKSRIIIAFDVGRGLRHSRSTLWPSREGGRRQGVLGGLRFADPSLYASDLWSLLSAYLSITTHLWK